MADITDEQKEKVIELLQRKSTELGRLPKKSDMTDDELLFVKSVFGPLPRAMEQAGLKELSLQRIEKIRRRKIKKRNTKTAKKREDKNA